MLIAVDIDQSSSEKLEKQYDILIWPCTLWIDSDAEIEVPAAPIGGLNIPRAGRFGAFSYSWSHISKFVGRVGRYCSIAGHVTFGDDEHPTNWLTTSNMVWDRNLVTGAFAARQNPGQRPQYKAIFPPDPPLIDIGNDVWIGGRCYIRRGVKIGDGAIIGSNAVVTRDVPPFAIVGGNPARVLKYRFSEEIIEMITALKWWQYSYADMRDIDFSNVTQACAIISDRVLKGEIKPYEPRTFKAKILKEEIMALQAFGSQALNV